MFCTHCGAPTTSVTQPPKVPIARRVSHARKIVIVVVMLVLLVGIGSVSLLVSKGPQVVVLGHRAVLGWVWIDEVRLDTLVLLLANKGGTGVTIGTLVISSNGVTYRAHNYTALTPGQTEEVSFDYSGIELPKQIGVADIRVIITLSSHPGQHVLVEQEIMISIPRARIGDTIDEVGTGYGLKDLSLTVLWWKESTIAVHGPYLSGYYTFTAKPGMKFIILAFRFQNNWIRAQTTPYLDRGEIATNAGFIYSVWGPISGARTEEYSPRWSTDEEVQNLIGNSGAYEELLPGESVEGCVVFEIPEDAIQLEASLVYVPVLIEFGAQP